MTRSLAFLVVALLLCIILSSQTADGLQCRGERLRNGTFFFNASYVVKEDVRDCETQWLVDEKLAGLSEADGNTKVMPPIIMATANTAFLQTCPEKLQCLLICPSGNINKRKQCLCDTTPSTTLPEFVAVLHSTPPTTLPEGSPQGFQRLFYYKQIGFPNWSIGVWIGIAFVVLVTVIVTIVLCRKKRMSGHGSTGSAEDVPFDV